MPRLRHLSALLVLAAAGCAPAATPAPAGPAAPRPANVHPGFDTRVYPGEETMRAWRRDSPYEWVGYYLASPCHRTSSWSGTRPVLEQAGWGIAILYVGQQLFESAPDVPPDSTRPIVCSRTLLTDAQGRADARDAIARARGEGFAPGSVVFLDVERMSSVPESMLAYYRAWTDEMLRDGSYVPGTYAHQVNAAALFAAAQAVYAGAGRTDGPPFWVSGGRGFTTEQPPYAVGLPFARVWQGIVDVDRTWGGVSLRIDENVADRPSPSTGPPPDTTRSISAPPPSPTEARQNGPKT